MFVTKRIHHGAFPMNGKFTRLLFLKTAKSKKRKTCRNIFFFRTMHTTFPTYICICWSRLAPVAPVCLCLCRLLPVRLPLPAPACSCMLLPLPAPACASASAGYCMLLPQPAPACPENKSGLECARLTQKLAPGNKTGQKRAHQTQLGNITDRKCAQPAQKVALRHKPRQKRAHQTQLGHKKDQKCAQLTQKPAPGNKTRQKCAHDAKRMSINKLNMFL